MIRRRPILALLAAETVSSLGSQMSGLALPWFVLIETGSATLMGVVFAVQLLPMVVFGIPSGQIIARLGPRQTMLIADFARAPLIALVPALHALGLLSFLLLLVIVALHGTFSVTYFTSQRLLLPEVAGEDERSVAQGNALIEGATNLTSYFGPALAGVLIALIGAANVLWLDAASTDRQRLKGRARLAQELYLGDRVLENCYAALTSKPQHDIEDLGLAPGTDRTESLYGRRKGRTRP